MSAEPDCNCPQALRLTADLDMQREALRSERASNEGNARREQALRAELARVTAERDAWKSRAQEAAGCHLCLGGAGLCSRHQPLEGKLGALLDERERLYRALEQIDDFFTRPMTAKDIARAALATRTLEGAAAAEPVSVADLATRLGVLRNDVIKALWGLGKMGHGLKDMVSAEIAAEVVAKLKGRLTTGVRVVVGEQVEVALRDAHGIRTWAGRFATVREVNGHGFVVGMLDLMFCDEGVTWRKKEPTPAAHEGEGRRVAPGDAIEVCWALLWRPGRVRKVHGREFSADVNGVGIRPFAVDDEGKTWRWPASSERSGT